MAVVNSKGFGGNNASGLLLGPHVVDDLLKARHGEAALRRWAKRNESVASQARDYDQAATAGDAETIYRYGEGVLHGEDLAISAEALGAPGYSHSIPLGDGQSVRLTARQQPPRR